MYHKYILAPFFLFPKEKGSKRFSFIIKDVFQISENFTPKASQGEAIEEIIRSIQRRETKRTLLGATGTGKTFLVAAIAAQLEKPSLVIAPNKTLAAQLYSEFQEILPKTRVEYFVSYYDYYQPEAYLAAQDLYIEKDASINEEIDRLRHSATNALLQTENTLVVASVSCIYGIGDPTVYKTTSLLLERGKKYPQKKLSEDLVAMLYERNDTALQRSKFSIRGERMEIWPADTRFALRISFWGDEIEKMEYFSPLTGEIYEKTDKHFLLPASHYTIEKEKMKTKILEIKEELDNRLIELRLDGKSLEAERLEKRVSYDIEMLEEQGFVAGIENYSRIFDGRKEGEPPYTLLDYFPKDYLCFIDESHITVPQIAGMYKADRARKESLIEHGFRLPSALDNRPLRLQEFLTRVPELICVSATPGEWEKTNAPVRAEQIIRPTGILDPKITIKEKKNQMPDLLKEIKARERRDERVLVTTLTKRMSEELSEYLLEKGVRVRYLHSEIDTLERLEIIEELKTGVISVLVGVNLLREGLDLPEVSLVAILDADKEGFLRNETSLVQTIGRAARNINGEVFFYAEETTHSMSQAIKETKRRRKLQEEYNSANDVKIEPLLKKRNKAKTATVPESDLSLPEEIAKTEKEMNLAATELRFEDAAKARDRLKELRSFLV
jgi:excinuclease ABC subunit B